MPARKADFDLVRAIALSLPGVEEGTTYGVPAFKLRGKLLTCPAINKAAEPDSIVVPVGFEQRAELICAEPDVYYLKDHYLNYPVVLARLSRIHRDALRDLLGMGWRFVSTQAKRPRRRSRTRKS